jgi:GLPGLI family protein
MKTMLKKMILSFLSFMHYSISHSQTSALTAQSLRYKYQLTYKTDSTSSISKSESFTLSLSNGLSVFKSDASSSMDSLATAYDNRPFNEQNAQLMMLDFAKLPNPYFTYSIYKKLAEHAVVFYEKIGKTLYSYKEPDTLLKWVILSTTANISGYKCQKAITTLGGRQFEAWFTRDIPIADGPYKFYGLPGLIIKANDNRNFYVFSLISLKQSMALQPIVIPSQTIKTTKEEFIKGKAAYAAGALDRVAAMGNTFTESDRQQFKERAKKRNNPLELK